ncbi:MAG: hypothetical protein AAFY71_18420 [Bacteroidota bacterium]
MALNSREQHQHSGDNSLNSQIGRDLIIENIQNLSLNIFLLYYPLDEAKLIRREYQKVCDKLKENPLLLIRKGEKKDFETLQKVLLEIGSFSPPNEVSLNEAKVFFRRIIDGDLVHLKNVKIGREAMVDIAYNVMTNGESVDEEIIELDFDDSNKKANLEEELLISKDETLQEIANENLNSRNLGGIIVVRQTGIELDNTQILDPKHLGFERVEDPDALVNKAKEGIITIKRVELIKNSNRHDHLVELTVKNETSIAQKFILPKGQLVENDDVNRNGQNLAIAEKQEVILTPLQEQTFPFYAYCANQTLELPHGSGNLTFYKFEDDTFLDGEKLWNQRKRFLKQNFGRKDYCKVFPK